MNKYRLQLAIMLAIPMLACGGQNSNFMSKRVDQGPYTFGQKVGEVTSRKLQEISGIAPSGRYKDCFWVNNDSGDKSNIYLINIDGDLIATLNIPAVENRDWEAVAIADGYIYIGEIGDNRAIYSDKKIYRVAEPAAIDVNKRDQELTANSVDAMCFNFANGQRDSESLMYDPISEELVILSKREDKVYVYTTPFIATAAGDEVVIDSCATLNLTQATSGDISIDGSKILVKNYLNIYLWHRSDGQSIAEALSVEPVVLNYDPEPQGEAIAWSIRDNEFYTVSEKSGGANPIIYRYRSCDR